MFVLLYVVDENGTITHIKGNSGRVVKHQALERAFLAHLSRRLTGELIG